MRGLTKNYTTKSGIVREASVVSTTENRVNIVIKKCCDPCHSEKALQLVSFLGTKKYYFEKLNELNPWRNAMQGPHDLSTGLTLDATKLPLLGPTVELFGHVTLVKGYALTNFVGCYALVALRDPPGTTVAVLTSDQRLQGLLETALATGYLIAFHGQKYTNPPSPGGGTWTVDVYSITDVTLYSFV
jgi:hypothetical protein